MLEMSVLVVGSYQSGMCVCVCVCGDCGSEYVNRCWHWKNACGSAFHCNKLGCYLIKRCEVCEPNCHANSTAPSPLTTHSLPPPSPLTHSLPTHPSLLPPSPPPPHRRKMKRSQSVVGSPYWMAPEVLNGRPYDGKADVFSYGVLLCELISRRDADPDDIPRRRDYGLDADKFRALPDVVNGQCPEEFMELAILCCAVRYMYTVLYTGHNYNNYIIIIIYRTPKTYVEKLVYNLLFYTHN